MEWHSEIQEIMEHPSKPHRCPINFKLKIAQEILIAQMVLNFHNEVQSN
jgi:hypothetical protein